jgi:hypothetical protein
MAAMSLSKPKNQQTMKSTLTFSLYILLIKGHSFFNVSDEVLLCPETGRALTKNFDYPGYSMYLVP